MSAQGTVEVPNPHLTVEEAGALLVIHPNAEVRRLQDAAREKLQRSREASEGIQIVSRPEIAGGQPLLAEGMGVRIVDLVGRVAAGDSIADVAHDFDVPAKSVQLLAEVTLAIGDVIAELPEGLVLEIADVRAAEADGPPLLDRIWADLRSKERS